MSYGFRVTNPSGELVVDSSALAYNYAGRPTLHRPGGVEYDGPGNARWQAFEYRIYLPNTSIPPLVFHAVPGDRTVSVWGVNALGGGWWEILVYSGSNATTDAFADPHAPDLYVFTNNSAPTGTYGVTIRRADGRFAWDISTPPLWLRQTGTLSARSGDNSNPWDFVGDSFALDGAISTPAILGATNGDWLRLNPMTEHVQQGVYAWRREGAALARRPVMTGLEIGFGGSGNLNLSYNLGAARAVIIEAANLP